MSFLLALVLFGLLTLVILLVEVGYVYSYFGTGFGWSSNRQINPERSKLGIRIQRTLQNQVETAGYAVPVLTVAAVTDLQSTAAQTAALLFIIGRAAFAPLYYTGIPFIRIPAWGMGWISIAFIGYVLLTSGSL